MVRHIQNYKNLNTEKEGVILQYHSESEFLTNYGGNLFNLYQKNFSLNTKMPGIVEKSFFLIQLT